MPLRASLLQARQSAQLSLKIDGTLGAKRTPRWVSSIICYGNGPRLRPSSVLRLSLVRNILASTIGIAVTSAILGRLGGSHGRDKDRAELDPLSGIIAANVGIIHLLQGNFTSAAGELNETVKFDPSWWGGYYVQGMMHVMQGNHNEAIASFETTAALSHRTKRSLGFLGYA